MEKRRTLPPKRAYVSWNRKTMSLNNITSGYVRVSAELSFSSFDSASLFHFSQCLVSES